MRLLGLNSTVLLQSYKQRPILIKKKLISKLNKPELKLRRLQQQLIRSVRLKKRLSVH